jgi:hypothetical protein
MNTRKQANAERREDRRRAREHLGELRRRLRDARVHRKQALFDAKERCRADRLAARERARALRVRVLEELRETLRAERSAARDTCTARLRDARAIQDDVGRSRAMLAAEREFQRALRAGERADRERRRQAPPSTCMGCRVETDDDVLANVSSDLAALYDRVKRTLILAMFAEDIGLLPQSYFTSLLYDGARNGDVEERLRELFRLMSTREVPGERAVPFFNGGLFTNPVTLPLGDAQLSALTKASEANWTFVDPHIFGSVFQGIMTDAERHKSGAHYTAHEDIMRVVGPTIVEPWRLRIRAAKTLGELFDVREALFKFRVLDPACGSGNFLYVAFRELYRLDTELLARNHHDVPSARTISKRVLLDVSSNVFQSPLPAYSCTPATARFGSPAAKCGNTIASNPTRYSMGWARSTSERSTQSDGCVWISPTISIPASRARSSIMFTATRDVRCWSRRPIVPGKSSRKTISRAVSHSPSRVPSQTHALSRSPALRRCNPSQVSRHT